MKAHKVTLWPHQVAGIAAIRAEWAKGVKRTLAVLATGAGKSTLYLSLLNDLLHEGLLTRALILAHRQELIDQPVSRAQEQFPDLAKEIGVVMGPTDECDKRVVIATVQTLMSNGRRERLLSHGPFSHMIWDECFVPETMVDGIPIRHIRPDSEITAFDVARKQFVKARVLRTSARRTGILCKVSVGGRILYCTPNHPFLTTGGEWVKAYLLRVGCSVVQCTTEQGQEARDVDMQRLRDLIRADADTICRVEAQRKAAGLLFQGMQSEVSLGTVIQNDGRDEPQICQRADAAQEPDAQSVVEGQGGSFAEGEPYPLGARESRREWETFARATGDDSGGARMAMRGGSLYRDEAGRHTNLLQDRRGECGPQDSCRDRWGISQRIGQEGTRPAQAGMVRSARVDSIAFLEQGRDAEFDRVCPEGLVYNLHVEPHNNYLAEGIVAHNCHHVCAEQWLKVLQGMGDPYLAGLTATPIRDDGDGLSRVFGSCAFRFPINAAIAAGILVPFSALGYTLPVSVEGLRETEEGWENEKLGDLLKSENCEECIFEKWQEAAGERQTIAFAASVAQSASLASYFRGRGVAAEHADGGTPKEERAAILARYRSGETRFLSNCQLFCEGLDVPETSALVMAAPIKGDLAYAQRLGRGIRVAPNKRDCIVLDFCPSDARDVIFAADVLGVPRDVKKAQAKADRAGILLGALRIDGFGQMTSIDPNEIVVKVLNYLAKGSILWSLQKDLAIATLNRETTLCIALPEFDRVAKAEELRRSGAWDARADKLLGWVSSVRLVRLAKDERGWWVPSLVGQYSDFAEARAAADEIVEREDLDVHLSKRRAPWRQELPTPKQLEQFARLGIQRTSGMSRGLAGQLISVSIARQHVNRLFEMRERELWD